MPRFGATEDDSHRPPLDKGGLQGGFRSQELAQTLATGERMHWVAPSEPSARAARTGRGRFRSFHYTIESVGKIAPLERRAVPRTKPGILAPSSE